MFVVLNILLTARLKMFEVDLKIVLKKQRRVGYQLFLGSSVGLVCMPTSML